MWSIEPTEALDDKPGEEKAKVVAIGAAVIVAVSGVAFTAMTNLPDINQF